MFEQLALRNANAPRPPVLEGYRLVVLIGAKLIANDNHVQLTGGQLRRDLRADRLPTWINTRARSSAIDRNVVALQHKSLEPKRLKQHLDLVIARVAPDVQQVAAQNAFELVQNCA